ncbi:HAD family phosphatase [Glutamicibacter sp. MNS18]|uniref:HAD family hydrolase n=1 Tax=Glutamicibacter sp. MNS18 TaxID=2989817 RepID=UPI002235C1CA|nr:HAD family phosphatase [Glutamicibacter sp. MNS18]MCW4464900.1 HAD family phosphatase [Glutamicibacter sp. MNS18]
MPTHSSTPHPAHPTSHLQAVLWDMDGTLIDTEPYWMAAEANLVTSFGGSWSPEQAHALVGAALPDAATVLQQAGVRLTSREIIDALSGEVIRGLRTELIWRPGALELLAALSAAGIPQALVTMSERGIVSDFLAQLPGSYFDVTVAGDEVPSGKPTPVPYLRGLELLGEKFETRLDPARCVGFEDSLPGITAASRAGLHAVLVPNATDPGQGPWRRLDSLADLTPGHLENWLEPINA